jgi:hypothetical protein
MSCGTGECGCGCEELVQLKVPSKVVDASKRDGTSEEGSGQKPISSPETPS